MNHSVSLLLIPKLLDKRATESSGVPMCNTFFVCAPVALIPFESLFLRVAYILRTYHNHAIILLNLATATNIFNQIYVRLKIALNCAVGFLKFMKIFQRWELRPHTPLLWEWWFHKQEFIFLDTFDKLRLLRNYVWQ